MHSLLLLQMLMSCMNAVRDICTGRRRMAGAWRLVGYPVVRNFVHDVVLNIAEGVLNGLHGLQAAVGARYAGS